ncbi:MAG: PP2C family protein-serine/threonine phosphatase [Frankia sp.]
MHSRMVPGGAARAALLLVLAVIVDMVVPDITVAGFFGLAPLVAAATSGPRTVAAIGSASVVAAVASGTWDHRFGSGQHLVACLLVGTMGAFAVGLSVARLRREQELGHVRNVAYVAQHALLPAVPGKLGGVGFATRYLSAAHEALIGGDLYEVVSTPQTLRMIIGDVKGKGLPAVRLTAVVLGAFREAAVTWLDLEQVAAACGRAVTREADTEDFVTALLVDMHADGTLRLLNAGHPPPVLVTPDGARKLRLPPSSPPLGIAESYTAGSDRWEPGDRLMLFTDGLIEARDREGRFFAFDDHVEDLAMGSLDEALDRLTVQLRTHVGGDLKDDLALLAAERLGDRVPRARRADAASPVGVVAPDGAQAGILDSAERDSPASKRNPRSASAPASS